MDVLTTISLSNSRVLQRNLYGTKYCFFSEKQISLIDSLNLGMRLRLESCRVNLLTWYYCLAKEYIVPPGRRLIDQICQALLGEIGVEQPVPESAVEVSETNSVPTESEQLISKLIQQGCLGDELLLEFRDLKSEPLWHQILLLFRETDQFNRLIKSRNEVEIRIMSGELTDLVLLPSKKDFIVDPGRRLLDQICQELQNVIQGDQSLPDSDDEIDSSILTRYRAKLLVKEQGWDVVIPDGVTSIGDKAFHGNQLNSVVIPNSVTSIGHFAFAQNQLSSVVIPKGVTSIGDDAFRENLLSSVVIPDGVTSIGYRAFYKNQLSSVVIPKGVASIGGFAFADNQLSSVVIPSSVISIGEYAFRENQLSSVVIPDGVTSIGGWAFSENQLSSVVIPSSVTSIGDNAFSKNQLSSVVIPNSVESIGDYAFSENQLSSVVISDGVTSIGEGAFYINQLSSLVIPDSVKLIGIGAFQENKLSSVVLSNGDISLGGAAFRANQLSHVEIPEGVTSIGEAVFYKNQLRSVVIPQLNQLVMGHSTKSTK